MTHSSLAACVSILRKDFTDYCAQKLQAIGLSQGLLYFILYIGKHPGCSPRELGQALQMDIGYTTRSLAKLEQNGFIIQEQNPKDRRSHILSLTGTGESAFQYSRSLFSQWDEEVMKDMEPEDRGLLLALLKRLVRTERREIHV